MLRFLIAALTFIRLSIRALIGLFTFELLVSEYYAPAAKVVRAHLDTHLVTREDSDVVHPHFAGNGGEDLMPVLEFHLEHSVAECLDDHAVLLNE